MTGPLQHLAIIMDGNGRWAQLRGKHRFFGHLKGSRVAKKIIQEAVDLKIPYLTLYTFSTENWSRPKTEVQFLMNLLNRYLKRELDNLNKNNIRFRTIGHLDDLPKNIQKLLLDTTKKTENNTGLTLVFALNYGGRQEICDGFKALAASLRAEKISENDICEELISKYMPSSFLPSPDLIVRTSGEKRLSNFLLWQSAYSEFYFTNTLWPDFTKVHLNQALDDYLKRERRYGCVKNIIADNQTMTQPEAKPYLDANN